MRNLTIAEAKTFVTTKSELLEFRTFRKHGQTRSYVTFRGAFEASALAKVGVPNIIVELELSYNDNPLVDPAKLIPAINEAIEYIAKAPEHLDFHMDIFSEYEDEIDKVEKGTIERERLIHFAGSAGATINLLSAINAHIVAYGLPDRA